jgi:ADP-ribose pyrophosphatase
MANIKKWITINSRYVIDHQWSRVRQDQVKLPNGKIVDDFFINVRPDIALILPVTIDRNIVFVRQYRHGVAEILLELPAGSFHPTQEDGLIAAKRELEEETGYVSSQFTQLTTLYDNPVKDTNKIHLFVAENAVKAGTQKLDETEEIEIVLIAIDQVKDKITSGDICVCGSITAIFLGLDFLYPLYM